MKFDRITPTDCLNHSAQADTETGWVKNRFAWCQISKYTALRAVPQEPVQYADTYVMLIGATFSGSGSRTQDPKASTSRDIVIDTYVYKVVTSGKMPPTKSLVLGIDISNKPYCNHIQAWNGSPITNHRLKKISDWKLGASSSDPAFQARVHCDLEHAPTDNGEFKVAARVQAYSQYPDWPLVKAYNRGDHTVVRCDSASYISFDGGCVFNNTVSSIELKRGQKYDKAYEHYWKACYTSGDTYPSQLGAAKVIPGCASYPANTRPGPEKRLHRVQKPNQPNNNARAQTRCNSLWPNYSTAGYECDEYPFASSKERSAEIDEARNFSVCRLPGGYYGDNQTAGRILARFYDLERILVNDDEYFLRFNTHLDGQAGRPLAPNRDQLCGTPNSASPYA